MLIRALNEYPFDPGLALHRAVEASLFVEQPLLPPLLDLGCSDGVFAGLCFNTDGVSTLPGLKIGIDSFQSILQQTRERAIYRYLLNGDALTLPFKNEAFNTVISNSVLTHIPELKETLAEIYRILRKKGFLIFSVPSIFFGKYLFASQILHCLGLRHQSFRFANRYRRNWKQYHFLSLTAWKEILREMGFKLIHFQYYLSQKASFWWSLYFFLVRIGIGKLQIGTLLNSIFQRPNLSSDLSFNWISRVFFWQTAPFLAKKIEKSGGSLFLVAEKL